MSFTFSFNAAYVICKVKNFVKENSINILALLCIIVTMIETCVHWFPTGVYGDVHRVKILFNKKDNALVQMAEPHQAQLGKLLHFYTIIEHLANLIFIIISEKSWVF